MSPANVSSFVGDLVEMAKAYEELPAVRHNLEEVGALLEEERKTVQDRELTILKLKQEIEMLNSAKRSLEVERDDAQFHALEADDRTQRALDFIKATFGNAGSLIQALEPPRQEAPKPEDTPNPVSPAPGVAGSGEKAESGEHPLLYLGEASPLPTSSSGGIGSGSTSPEPMAAPLNEPSPSAPEVAAQPRPTAHGAQSTAEVSASSSSGASMTTEHVLSGTDATSPTAEPGGFSMPPQSRPYEGKTWSQVRADLKEDEAMPTKDEWLAGGGTIDNWYA